MTRFPLAALALSGLLLAAACENMTPEQRTVAGAAGGAAAGLITAEALDADDDWRLIAGLAGAAAGVMVAQNATTDRCAYARGDGTYYYAPCP
ncbi:glucose-6-phosphate isomerase [Sagittula salina]|uniref:Glucose-6-phosphate isomerase n=1 Tax=Sagittula salina TaxID=2820268 RepID=A0A940MQD6_9RHOB|nr:glucose-6-phosphate isomerase [Sagittula salina]MBP0482187.1 glucose-6-phosphate isomerase [Sagittula salina]